MIIIMQHNMGGGRAWRQHQRGAGGVVQEALRAVEEWPAVGFHNFNLRMFNWRVSNPNKSIVDVFCGHDVGFQCARVSAQKKTMKFRKSTVVGLFRDLGDLAISSMSFSTGFEAHRIEFDRVQCHQREAL